MKFHILTLFPEMVRQGLETSIIGRGMERRLIELNTVNIRDFTQEKHGRVDDYPYGGGAGMLMQAQPVFDAWKSIFGAGAEALAGAGIEEDAEALAGAGIEKDAEAFVGVGIEETVEALASDDVREKRVVSGKTRNIRTVYVTPQGEPFTQRKARELAAEEELVILCGHYEGIDERVLEETVTDYISIGDYVLTGGELAAMVIVDAVGRLVPGVLGNETSAEAESFHRDLLEYPQYSRPEVWHGKKVPEVLLSGNHGRVKQWRLERAKERTAAVRPDLYRKYEEKQAVIRKLAKDKRNHIHVMESLDSGRGEILYRKGGQLLVEDWAAGVRMLLCEEASGTCGQSAGLPTWLEASEWLQACLAKQPGASGWQSEGRPKRRGASERPWRLAVLQGGLAKELQGRGFHVLERCSQYLYTTGQSLPVRHRDIRRLTRENLEYVSGHSSWQASEFYMQYLEERIQAGAMYGAFEDGRLRGFIGIHEAGGMGMLYVEEAYRGNGMGKTLVSHQINCILEQGRIPYCHVPQNSPAAEAILEKLGLYRAGKTVWWLE